MSVIRIETQISGDTLYLPQLSALIGKSVEIVVTELPVQPRAESPEKWVSPLAGTVIEYTDPFGPVVSPTDWKAAQ
ncbi:MAG TPA: hypothetical protein VF175_12735 [Lacipirellula sp.]